MRPLISKFVSLIFLTSVSNAQQQHLLDPVSSLISPNQATVPYSLTRNYCWLLAHSSVSVGDSIIITDGMAKYRVRQNNTDAFVPDFNSETLSLSLSLSFSVDDPPLTTLAQRPRHSPPVNKGGEMLLGRSGAYGRVQADRDLLVFRGYANSRTSPASPSDPQGPNGWNAGHRGMLEFDTKTKVLRNLSMDGYTAVDAGYGFHYGILQPFLGTDKQNGMLLSIMSEKTPITPVDSMSNDPIDTEGVGFSQARRREG